MIPTTPRAAFFEQPERLLALVLLWHACFWVIAPALSYRMLPLDTLELLGWGQEWQWGYYKHPPLGAWLGEIALSMGGGRLESQYVLAQACLLIALIYIWRCARMFLDPHRAVLATVLLEGSYFHTYLIPNFNMNSLQLPIWAGLSFHFLQGLRGNHRHWLAFGLLVALAMLTKYSGALLIATCGAIALATAEGRRALRQPLFWAGALLALLLFAPHAAWLARHGELPLSYLASFDAGNLPPWRAHFIEPLRFAAGALLGLLFSGLLFMLVKAGPRARPTPERWLLLALILGPLLLSMAYGLVSGSRLKSTWTFPFLSLAGVALFVWYPTVVDGQRWRRFLLALIAVMLVTSSAHLYYKLRSDQPKTAFDGAALANAVASGWQSTYPQPLRIVVGNHVLAAIVSGYAPTRPSMLVNGDFALSLWLDPAQLEAHGAAVVCPADGACFPQYAHAMTPVQSVEIDGQRFRYAFIAPLNSAVQ